MMFVSVSCVCNSAQDDAPQVQCATSAPTTTTTTATTTAEVYYDSFCNDAVASDAERQQYCKSVCSQMGESL
jgi:hypothetical protein